MDFDFNITEVENIIDDYESTFLKLIFSGNDVYYPFINSLRKACINQVPIYGFHISKINILRNNSVYDCSEMKLRLSQLPIKNINHEVVLLPLKYYKNVNFADNKIEKHPDDNTNIEIYVKAKNNGPEKMFNVSTNDIKININNEIIKNETIYSKKYPILLIKLRPGEEFECSMKAVLATGELDSIFNASNTYYEEISENKFEFCIESSGQFSEYEILLRSINIIIEKLNLLKENIKLNQYNIIITKSNSMIIEISNEDHTCGGPINFILQNMKEVLFSGVSKPDFMQKIISIKFKVADNYNPLEIFDQAVNKTIKIYENINNKIIKLRGGK